MTLHALLLTLAAWWYVYHPPSINLAAVNDSVNSPIIVTPIPDSPPPPPPKPKSPPPKPKPKPKRKFPHAVPPPLRDDSGEANGTGTANRSTPGKAPMQAAAGLEQARLNRSEHPEPPDSASALTDAPVPSQQPTITPPEPPREVGVPDSSNTPTPILPAQSTLIALGDRSKLSPRAMPPSSGRHIAAIARRTPIAKSAITTGHASDTSSLPFARANNVIFKDGQMVGRTGRRVTTTPIDFGLAAQADAAALPDPRVVLGVTVAASGNVQNVVILHSSGSDNIDLPAQNAVYNWWFQPLKDGVGHPLPDVWVVRLYW